MDMYPSGSIKLLELENKDIKLEIYGDDLDEELKNRRINRNIPAGVGVFSSEEDPILKTLVDGGQIVENNGRTMMPVFFENGQYDIVVESRIDSKLSFIQNGINIDRYFKKVKNINLGSLKFRSDVGYTNLDIYDNGRKILSLMIEVFPSKMDYRKDYEEMIGEVNEEIASIAFTLLDKTYLESQLVDREYQTRTEFINILDYIFQDFIASIDFIRRNFKHNIIESERVVSVHKARRISPRTRSYLRARPHLLVEREDGFIELNSKSYMPREVVELRKETTVDILENQLVKYMIRDVIKRIDNLKKILVRTSDQDYRNRIESRYRLGDKKKVLNRYLKEDFKNIKDISPRNTMSLVFQMSAGYKDAYKKYKILSKGLDLGDDLFKITPKKIYELYEIWCYIRLHKILYELGYDVKHYGIIDYKDNGLYLRLNTDQEASMIYQKDDQALRLWYNKSYSVPTTRQRPDTVLFIENLNSKQKRTYLFDAKYRMKLEEDGSEGPLEEDINVMHRYRDAIVSEMGDGIKYKYETFGAYVMFPCSDEDSFRNHRFYKSIDDVNIGAFPMLPGSTSLIRNHLAKILSESDLEAKESRLVLDEFDDYAKFKRQDVMVVNALDQEHLDAYLKYGFYHIPSSQLSNVRLGVEYIAFYQPKTSFKDKSGIYYYGRISSTRKYRRYECKEIPARHRKNQIYLRFELEDIREISRIEAYEIGPVTLSYTSLYLLHNAENTRELKVKSNLEMRVYKLLRKLALEEKVSLRKELTSKKDVEDYRLADRQIEIVDGKYIRLDGKSMTYRDLEEELYK